MGRAIQSEQAENRDAHASEVRGLRVLVVDDDDDTRELLAMILTEAGAMATCASSVHGAFELLVSARPQIIISDIEMPFENGHSFLRNLRSVLDEDGGKTPTIALTGCTLPEDRAKALASGFNVYLPKPATPAEVISALAEVARTFDLAPAESQPSP